MGFLTLNLMMVCSYLMLMRAIATHKLKTQLKKEANLISTVFLVFTLSYILRTLWALFLMIKYRRKTFGDVSFLYKFYLISGALPMIWDICPIGLLLYYHYKNFAPAKENKYTSADIGGTVEFESSSSPTRDGLLREEIAELQNSLTSWNDDDESFVSSSQDTSDLNGGTVEQGSLLVVEEDSELEVLMIRRTKARYSLNITEQRSD